MQCILLKSQRAECSERITKENEMVSMCRTTTQQPNFYIKNNMVYVYFKGWSMSKII